MRDGTTPRFSPKSTPPLKNNILSGITLLALVEVLYTRLVHIEWRKHWLRIAILLMLSAINSCISIVEQMLHGRAIARQQLNDRPLFILGHPRTGTTLLHTLLALDHEQFATCSTFCAGFPSGFLWLERFKGLFAGVVDSKRPMDNMELSFDTPQEDEIATNVLSAGRSPYMPLVFMTDEPSFRPFFSFRDACPEDTRRWVESFLYLLRKLSLRADRTGPPGRRLLLKSPVHTARIELLLTLFPHAQFVYVHRDPLTVYRSAVHMANTTYWYSYLVSPSDEEIHEFILNQFEVLWDEYARARSLIPDGNLVEISYQELAADPEEAVAGIYRRLGLASDKARVCERVRHMNETKLRNYQTNVFPSLPPPLAQHVATRWAAYAAEWGYVKDSEVLTLATS